MDIFSARLKWLREKKGYTQKEIAEKIGMTSSSYSKYEYGLREPNLETLAKLPYILGENVDFLLGVDNFDSVGYELFSEYRSNKHYLEKIMRLMDEEAEPDSNLSEKRIEMHISNLEAYEKTVPISKLNYEQYVKKIPYAVYIEPVSGEESGFKMKRYDNRMNSKGDQ